MKNLSIGWLVCCLLVLLWLVPSTQAHTYQGINVQFSGGHNYNTVRFARVVQTFSYNYTAPVALAPAYSTFSAAPCQQGQLQSSYQAPPVFRAPEVTPCTATYQLFSAPQYNAGYAAPYSAGFAAPSYSYRTFNYGSNFSAGHYDLARSSFRAPVRVAEVRVSNGFRFAAAGGRSVVQVRVPRVAAPGSSIQIQQQRGFFGRTVTNVNVK